MKRRLGRFDALPFALVALGVWLVVLVRAPLAAEHAAQAATEGESALLAPEHMIVASLGHREALADYLFGHTLVAYGQAFQEKRPFSLAKRYLDTINTLAPTFDKPYLFADTLLTLQPTPATTEQYLAAREVLRRGTRELPYHAELWLVAGQYMAFLASPHLPEPFKQEFRLEGGRLLARTCELASENRNIPYHCISAANILDKVGHREAVIRMLSRTLAVNDDEEFQARALGFLQHAVSEREAERMQARLERVSAEWSAAVPFLRRGSLSLIGPRSEPLRCAGLASFSSAGCHTTWSTWAEALDDSAGRTAKSHASDTTHDDVSARDAGTDPGDFVRGVQ